MLKDLWPNISSSVLSGLPAWTMNDTAEWWRLWNGNPVSSARLHADRKLAERACRSGFSAHYVRTARLVHDRTVARGDASYSRALSRLVKTDLLVLDDWLLTSLKESEREISSSSSKIATNERRRSSPARSP